MFNIGFGELLVVLVIAYLVVGPKDLPKVARWLGRMVKRVRLMVQELKQEVGWEDLEREAVSVKQDIDQTVKENDVTADIRSVSSDLRKNIEEAKKLSRKKP